MSELIPSTQKKRKDRYYGAPCMPTVKGSLWECEDREEYLKVRSSYEEQEANCNNCAHLTRFKQAKCPSGFMGGKCQKMNVQVRFHPEDPQGCPQWQTRRTP